MKNLLRKPLTYIVAGVVLAAAVGGIFLVYALTKSPIETEWGQTYYGFIKDKLKDSSEEVGIIDGTGSDMRFLELEGQEDPAMVITSPESARANIYFIQNRVVNTLIYTQVTQVVFLYNISIQKYDYYLHVTVDGKDIYKSLSSLLAEQFAGENPTKTLESDPDYVFPSPDSESTDENSPAYDQVFVEPEISETSTPFSPDMSDKDLQDAVAATEKNYRTQDEIVDEKVQEEVEEKVKIIKDQTLTNDNVAEKLQPHLKWIYALDRGSLSGLRTVYSYEPKDPDFCQQLGLPKNTFMDSYNCQELVGAGSIANMKNTALQYLSDQVYRQLDGDRVLNDEIYDAAGGVYFVFQGGGVGGASEPRFDPATAEVVGSDSGKTVVSFPVYLQSIAVDLDGTLYKTFTLTVEYRNDDFIVTELSL